jgi:hypothetical protein
MLLILLEGSAPPLARVGAPIYIPVNHDIN